MSKLTGYIIITLGMVLLLNLAGLPTFTGGILSLIGIDINNVSEISTTALYVAILAAIGLLVSVSGVKIGVFGTPTSSIFASATLATPLVILVADFTNIIVKTSETGVNWVSYISFLLLVPLAVGYLFALFDWARGID